MLREGGEEAAAEIELASTWTPGRRDEELDWQTVDRALREIRHSRAALDAEEMHWLREAEALQIWRPLGMVSALDYLERVLGYAPRTAQDRLRVARALGTLPRLTAALASDELSYSAVRELTRVATPGTEASWIAAAAGKNLRQIEELVADHHPGDRPDDPPDPEARTHVVRFELSATTLALLRQAHMVLDDERGTHLPDDPFMAALCSTVLDGARASEPNGRAKFQIAVTVCERCRQGWQEGAGAQIAISSAAVDRAMCDAQHIGSIDGSAPERSYQDVPPSVARFVWRRDGGRCRVPGCRSSRGLELHHVIHRADGGSHDASNLVLCCSSCHQAHHAGLLAITGTAEHLEVHRPGPASWSADAHASSPVARVGAHVDAHDVAFPAAVTGAHVDAHDAALPAAVTGAHVDAVNATSIESTGAHVDAANATSIESTGAHVDAASAKRSTAATGGCVDTASTPTATTSAHVCATSKLDAAILRTQARAALTGLGWKPATAQAAVADALTAARGAEVTLEQLIFESLRRCPAPRA